MTTITIDTRDWAITAEGHTGAGAAGLDQVCCAVSTLMQTLLYACRQMGYEMSHEKRDGYLRVQHVRGSGKLTEELLGAYRCTAMGLKMLSEAYPEHVRVVRIW